MVAANTQPGRRNSTLRYYNLPSLEIRLYRYRRCFSVPSRFRLRLGQNPACLLEPHELEDPQLARLALEHVAKLQRGFRPPQAEIGSIRRGGLNRLPGRIVPRLQASGAADVRGEAEGLPEVIFQTMNQISRHVVRVANVSYYYPRQIQKKMFFRLPRPGYPARSSGPHSRASILWHRLSSPVPGWAGWSEEKRRSATEDDGQKSPGRSE